VYNDNSANAIGMPCTGPCQFWSAMDEMSSIPGKFVKESGKPSLICGEKCISSNSTAHHRKSLLFGEIQSTERRST